MNKNEEIAKKNVLGAFNWIVGGYYNSMQDGQPNFIPDSVQDIKDEIYTSAMTNGYLIEGMESYDRAPKEMRFAGADFIKSIINDLCESDSDFNEIVEYLNNRRDEND